MQKFINPLYLEPHYSTKLWRAYHIYLKLFHDESIFQDACFDLEIPQEYLLSNDGWVSDHFTKLFIEKIKDKTGDLDIAYKVGAFSLDPRCINEYEYFLFKLIPMRLMLLMIPLQSQKINKFNNFKIHKNQLDTFELELTQVKEGQQCPDVIKNINGFVHGIVKFYDQKNIVSEVKKSGSSAFVKIKYDPNYKKISKFILSASIFFCSLFILNKYEFLQYVESSLILKNLLIILFLVSMASLFKFLFIMRYNHIYQAENTRKHEHLFQANLKLERRIQESMMLKNLSDNLVGAKQSSEVISSCLISIKDKFGYNKVAVFLISNENRKIYLHSQIGFDSSFLKDQVIEFDYPNPDKKEGFIATVIENGETFLADDIETYKVSLKPVNQNLIETLAVGSIIVSPLQNNKEKFGAIMVIKDKDDSVLTSEDKQLLERISSQLSLYFESASNFQSESKLRNIFQKYVPPMVLEQLNYKSGSVTGRLNPSKKEVCSIFMDLRGFTEACSLVDPEKAFLLVNTYASFTTAILAKYGAIIDNIVGDEIVSFFIKNDTSESYINNCILAAKEIKNAFNDFNSEIALFGVSKLNLGIGIHSGTAIVGSVGGEKKMNYTALGETINIASRLQALSKTFPDRNVPILISKVALEKSEFASGVVFQKSRLRGIKEEIEFAVINDINFERHQLVKAG